jgi:Ca2+-binding EF-hand superfamily protein
MDLGRVGRLTGLSALSPAAALQLFGGALSSSGGQTVSLAAFLAVFSDREEELCEDDRPHLLTTCTTLFKLFDANADGIVDFYELGAGISVLCGGTREEKARAAFALYDTNRDGVINFKELQTYLVGVFTMMHATAASASAWRHRSLGDVMATLDLAHSTASEAFAELSVSETASLSWEQFETWHEHQLPTPPPPPAAAACVSAPPPPPPGASPRSKQLVRKDSKLEAMGVDLEFVRRVTGLDTCDAADVLAEFTSAAADDGTLSLEAFASVFEDIVDPSQLSRSDLTSFNLILPALFDLFDEDDSQSVDVRELVAGITMLCGGSSDEKARSVFDLYDVDGDGVLTVDELTSYFHSIFRMTAATEGGLVAGRPVAELSRATAEDAMRAADLDRNGVLSWPEFQLWYSTEGK